MFSLLTLNLQATGLIRAAKLYDWLAARDDHAAVLTETSNGPGTAHLLDRFRTTGWTVHHTRSATGDRGTAIISRLPTTIRADLTAGISHPGRAVAVTLGTAPAVTLLGIYVPSSDRAPAKVAKKRAFLTTTLTALEAMTREERSSLILAGDYNVISRDHQPRYAAFQPFEYEFLERLAALELVDVNQHLSPGQQAHSWYGRGGNGYRFDYFYTGSAVASRTSKCSYLQQPRLLGITDHAAVHLIFTGEKPHAEGHPAAAPEVRPPTFSG